MHSHPSPQFTALSIVSKRKDSVSNIVRKMSLESWGLFEEFRICQREGGDQGVIALSGDKAAQLDIDHL
jgi:hypothetical protein